MPNSAPLDFFLFFSQQHPLSVGIPSTRHDDNPNKGYKYYKRNKSLQILAGPEYFHGRGLTYTTINFYAQTQQGSKVFVFDGIQDDAPMDRGPNK